LRDHDPSPWANPTASPFDFFSRGEENIAKEKKAPKSFGLREHETMEEFFHRRDEENEVAKSRESPKDRIARLSRERDRGFNRARCFLWLENDEGKLVRTSIERAYGKDLHYKMSAGHQRYDAFAQEWDFCDAEGFASLGKVGRNHREENQGNNDDYYDDDCDDDDDDDYPAFAPPKSSFAAAGTYGIEHSSCRAKADQNQRIVLSPRCR
jgi:hypothetical protein